MIAYIIASIVMLMPIHVYINYLIEKAKTNRKLRNDLASFAYLPMLWGIGLSTNGFIDLLTTNKNKIILILTIIGGIVLGFLGRKIRDKFFEKTENKFNRSNKLLDIAEESVKNAS